MGNAALALSGISKTFGGESGRPTVRAVRDASMTFHAGRIAFLCGENGAGKSTILRCAAGLALPDSGKVSVSGTALRRGRRAALAAGIAMVEQHFSLIDRLTVLENIILGQEPVKGLGLDLVRAREHARRVGDGLGVDLPLDVPVSELGVGDKQRVEIVRALARDARVVILDEPTAVLTPGEADALYATLRGLAEEGRTIVVVTHKLAEVFAHADDIVVMRHGDVRWTWDRADGARPAIGDIAREIMGHEPTPESSMRPRETGPVAMSLRGTTVGLALRGVDLDLHEGEIVGVAGVEGNGQRELVDALAGSVAYTGEISPPPTPARVRVVHEDRQEDGLVLDATVRDNLVLGELARFSRFGVLDLDAMDREAARRLEAIGADVPASALAGHLSGGNQQKVVMARALAAGASGVLVCAHPTRGVDVAAQAALWKKIVEARDRGMAVLLVTADLAELRALSNRIVVLCKGKIAARLPSTVSDEVLGRAMLGLPDDGGPS